MIFICHRNFHMSPVLARKSRSTFSKLQLTLDFYTSTANMLTVRTRFNDDEILTMSSAEDGKTTTSPNDHWSSLHGYRTASQETSTDSNGNLRRQLQSMISSRRQQRNYVRERSSAMTTASVNCQTKHSICHLTDYCWTTALTKRANTSMEYLHNETCRIFEWQFCCDKHPVAASHWKTFSRDAVLLMLLEWPLNFF
jgi:hypothetical protein